MRASVSLAGHPAAMRSRVCVSQASASTSFILAIYERGNCRPVFRPGVVPSSLHGETPFARPRKADHRSGLTRQRGGRTSVTDIPGTDCRSDRNSALCPTDRARIVAEIVILRRRFNQFQKSYKIWDFCNGRFCLAPSAPYEIRSLGVIYTEAWCIDGMQISV